MAECKILSKRYPNVYSDSGIDKYSNNWTEIRINVWHCSRIMIQRPITSKEKWLTLSDWLLSVYPGFCGFISSDARTMARAQTFSLFRYRPNSVTDKIRDTNWKWRELVKATPGKVGFYLGDQKFDWGASKITKHLVLVCTLSCLSQMEHDTSKEMADQHLITLLYSAEISTSFLFLQTMFVLLIHFCLPFTKNNSINATSIYTKPSYPLLIQRWAKVTSRQLHRKNGISLVKLFTWSICARNVKPS